MTTNPSLQFVLPSFHGQVIDTYMTGGSATDGHKRSPTPVSGDDK